MKLFCETIEEQEKLKQKLEQIIEYKTKGSTIRSKTRWFNEGEKYSKYFNLEKRHCYKKTVKSLRTENGATIGTDKDILQEAKNKVSIKSYIHPVKHVQTCTTVRSILKIMLKSLMIYKKNHAKEHWNCKSA